MSEWQPARLFHGAHVGPYWVKPWPLALVGPHTMREYNKFGCTCKKFYIIRGIEKLACEHEILTD